MIKFELYLNGTLKEERIIKPDQEKEVYQYFRRIATEQDAPWEIFRTARAKMRHTNRTEFLLWKKYISRQDVIKHRQELLAKYSDAVHHAKYGYQPKFKTI